MRACKHDRTWLRLGEVCLHAAVAATAQPVYALMVRQQKMRDRSWCESPLEAVVRSSSRKAWDGWR